MNFKGEGLILRSSGIIFYQSRLRTSRRKQEQPTSDKMRSGPANLIDDQLEEAHGKEYVWLDRAHPS